MTIVRYPTALRLDHARIQSSIAQSIPNATVTNITLGTTQYDSNGLKSGNSLVARKAGLYDIWAQVFWDISATGLRLVIMKINGSELCRIQGPSATAAGDGTCQQLSTQAQLTVGDAITIDGYQGSGGALNATAANSFLAMAMVSLS